MSKFKTTDEQPPRPKVTPELLTALRETLREWLKSNEGPWTVSADDLKAQLKTRDIDATGDSIGSGFAELAQNGLIKFSKEGAALGTWDIQWISPTI